MKEMPVFAAIVYLWSVFRHSLDYVATFLELSPAEQALVGMLLWAAYVWLRKFWAKFRK